MLVIFYLISLLLAPFSAVAKDIQFEDMHGNITPFTSLRGQWVLLHYWATWCETCMHEIPTLNRFYQKNKHRAALFGVNFDNLSTEEQRQIIAQYNIRYPNLKYNPAGDFNLGEIRAVPVTFIFNPEGKLSQTLYGAQTIQSLTKILAQN